MEDITDIKIANSLEEFWKFFQELPPLPEGWTREYHTGDDPKSASFGISIFDYPSIIISPSEHSAFPKITIIRLPFYVAVRIPEIKHFVNSINSFGEEFLKHFPDIVNKYSNLEKKET